MAFTKQNIFKLFVFDVGLLGCMLELTPGTLVLQDYGQTKGFFAENFVACELSAAGENDALFMVWTQLRDRIPQGLRGGDCPDRGQIRYPNKGEEPPILHGEIRTAVGDKGYGKSPEHQ